MGGRWIPAFAGMGMVRWFAECAYVGVNCVVNGGRPACLPCQNVLMV